jgi:hypothetical protein
MTPLTGPQFFPSRSTGTATLVPDSSAYEAVRVGSCLRGAYYEQSQGRGSSAKNQYSEIFLHLTFPPQKTWLMFRFSISYCSYLYRKVRNNRLGTLFGYF